MSASLGQYIAITLSVSTFVVKYNIPELDHLPYSSGLMQCNFYLFSKIKSVLKGTRFQTTEAVKKKRLHV